jgi:hypothetical protein
MTHLNEGQRSVQIDALPVDVIARQAGDLVDQGYH